ncbi:DUF7282 domain-containing protein [Halorarius halobius]|uniref:DUF7282 domain-containing protein n=1 Tax=Halorarius halobius TaxID=2962671 RepID=UPI0020CF4363|nr:PGF-CTERM sorting domain-containing protein [Halorarius halobius]
MTRTTLRATALSALVVLATLSGAAAVGGTTASTTVAVDATPTDPNDARATHTVVFTVGADAESAGAVFNDVLVDYTAGAPEADVSNVGAGSMGRIGIDRGGDDPGTRIDVAANVSTVSAKKDGTAVRIATKGNLTLQAGDEVVVVLTPVQNPQNAGDAAVEVTVNSQGAADTATGTVGYEYNDAAVRFDNETTAGETVTVESVSLSEGGFVVVQNRTGETPNEVRGASTYLPPGNHSNVVVPLSPGIDADATLYAQVYTDTNGDRRFRFDDTGGDVDDPYLTDDGNVMASDAARLTYDSSASESTPTDRTATDTATPTPDGDTPTPSPTPDDADGETPTLSPTPTPEDGEDTPTASPTPDDADDATETDDGAGNATVTPTDSPTPQGTVSVTVTASPTDEDRQGPADGETPTGQPGFGVLAVLAALAAVALLARR